MEKRRPKPSSAPSARDCIVLDAVLGGRTLKAAGALIGVSRGRAWQICVRWGCDQRTPNRISDEELARAVGLLDRGMPIKHIACTLKKQPSTLWNHLIRTGTWASGGRPSSQRPWTEDEEVAIRKGRVMDRHGRARRSFSLIAADLDRSIGSVLGKAKRMGLCRIEGPIIAAKQNMGPGGHPRQARIDESGEAA